MLPGADMDWDKLQTFHTVAAIGSFTRAVGLRLNHYEDRGSGIAVVAIA